MPFNASHKNAFSVALMLSTLLTALACKAQAETLQEAMTAAYNSNPTLAAQRAALRGTDEDVSTAVAGFRPTIEAQGNYQVRKLDQPGNTTQGLATLSEPLFRGFRTVNGVKLAKISVQAGRQQLRSTEIQTLLDTVSAYMNVVRDQSVLALNINQVQVLQQQLKASQDRFRVGELTRTDVAQSDSRLATAVSARIQAEGQLTASREAYRKAVGQAPGTLAPAPPLPPLPKTIEEATDLAVVQSPTAVEAQLNEKAARSQIDIAKGVLLPTVGVSAGINYNRFPSQNAVIPAQTQTYATVGGNVTIPLYQNGSEYAAVRKAQQLRSQRTLEIAVADRAVTEQVHNAWEALRTASASIVSSKSAVKSSEVALEGVKQEQTVGSRTTLDVLNAEQELLNAKVNLVAAQRNEYVAGFQLLATTGSLDAKYLGLPVELYDPEVHYQQAKGRLIGWDAAK